MNKLTIIVPSINRVLFIERIRKFYENCSFNIIIKNDPNKTVKQCMLESNITTPYVVFCGDDDLIIPKAANKCIEFLDNNKEYIACNGNAYLFSTINDLPFSKIKAITPYPLMSLESGSQAERIKYINNNYFVNIFSIHRKEAWIKMWEKREENIEYNNSLDTETIPVFISAKLGKTKHLNTNYLFRQVHNNRVLVTKELIPTDSLIRYALNKNGIFIDGDILPIKKTNKLINKLINKLSNITSKILAFLWNPINKEILHDNVK